MTEIKKASLVLKTSDITTSSDYVIGLNYQGEIGSCNSKLSSITWNNVNLRLLLGDMHDKYDEFNLCLNSISTGYANNIDINQDSKNVIIKLSGLPWLNNSYNVSRTTNTNESIISSFRFLSTSSTSNFYNGCSISTFTKNQEIANLTIEYLRISDNLIENSNMYGTYITNLTGTCALGTNVLTLSSLNLIISPGSVINGAGIPLNTIITSITGTSTTISQNSTALLSTTPLTIIPIQNYPASVFMFDIYGIPKTENKNGSRIN